MRCFFHFKEINCHKQVREFFKAVISLIKRGVVGDVGSYRAQKSPAIILFTRFYRLAQKVDKLGIAFEIFVLFLSGYALPFAYIEHGILHFEPKPTVTAVNHWR